MINLSDNKIKIAVDTGGSETSLENIIKGLNISFQRNKNYEFLVFGKEDCILKELKKYDDLSKKIEIIHCDEFIEMKDKPSEVLRKKQKSSMARTIKSVEEGKAHAALSCGNTGALMALSLFNLKTIENIKRPAIATIWPNLKGESIVLDLGANIKTDSQTLIDNAILGSSLATAIFRINNPSIGLLNVGKEESKGDEIIQKTAKNLKDLDYKKLINYYGFVEGDSISKGLTNVVVTDGFTGNIALKTAEGTAVMIKSYIKKSLESSVLSKIGALFATHALLALKNKLNPNTHNCGIFLGLNSPVIKCHGSSDYLGISYAADILYQLIENNINQKIEKNIARFSE